MTRSLHGIDAADGAVLGTNYLQGCKPRHGGNPAARPSMWLAIGRWFRRVDRSYTPMVKGCMHMVAVPAFEEREARFDRG